MKVISLINGLFFDETGLWIGLNDMNYYRHYTWQDSAPFFITNTLSYSNSDQPDNGQFCDEAGLWIGLNYMHHHRCYNGKKVPHFSLQNLYLTATVISLINGQFSDEAGLWIGLNDMNHNRRYTWQDSAPLIFTNWAKGQPGYGVFPLFF